MSETLKVRCKEDCGNAPKKVVLRDFNIAFAQNDIDALIQNVTNDIVWNIIGDKQIRGIEDFTLALQEMKHYKAISLHIDHIITHGKTASANGVLYFEDSSAFAFCDVYVFNSSAKDARIKEMTSFVIRVDS